MTTYDPQQPWLSEPLPPSKAEVAAAAKAARWTNADGTPMTWAQKVARNAEDVASFKAQHPDASPDGAAKECSVSKATAEKIYAGINDGDRSPVTGMPWKNAGADPAAYRPARARPADVEAVDEPGAPGALTADSPGQTDRVAAALAKAHAHEAVISDAAEDTTDVEVEPQEPGQPAVEAPAEDLPELAETLAAIDQLDTGADVTVPLDEAAAAELDRRLREQAEHAWASLDRLGELVAQAKAGQVYLTLGFRSWTGYLADAIGGARCGRMLDVDARRAFVELLTVEGVSTRAAAAALGSSEATVRRDQAANDQVRHDDAPDEDVEAAPSTVTGLDGKAYPKPPKKKTAAAPAVKPSAPADEPVMKRWSLIYHWDGSAELLIDFLAHDSLNIPIGGTRLSPRITADVAEDMARQLRDGQAGISNLIDRLAKRAGDSRP